MLKSTGHGPNDTVAADMADATIEGVGDEEAVGSGPNPVGAGELGHNGRPAVSGKPATAGTGDRGDDTRGINPPYAVVVVVSDVDVALLVDIDPGGTVQSGAKRATAVAAIPFVATAGQGHDGVFRGAEAKASGVASNRSEGQSARAC